MTLTPALKFLIIVVAATVGLLSEFWLEAEPDLISELGLSDGVYSIVNRLLSKLDLGMSALLIYLGLRAPTLEKPPAV
jgi:hypothetical protein